MQVLWGMWYTRQFPVLESFQASFQKIVFPDLDSREACTVTIANAMRRKEADVSVASIWMESVPWITRRAVNQASRGRRWPCRAVGTRCCKQGLEDSRARCSERKIAELISANLKKQAKSRKPSTTSVQWSTMGAVADTSFCTAADVVFRSTARDTRLGKGLVRACTQSQAPQRQTPLECLLFSRGSQQTGPNPYLTRTHFRGRAHPSIE